MKRTMTWMDRHMGALILVVTILLMGTMTYGATVDAPVKGALLKRADIEAGDYRVAVSLAKGSDKPIIFTPEGRPLLDLSAWESVVTVNGTRQTLYRNVYNMVQDENVIVLTWSHDHYALQQRIVAEESGVTIEWSWIRHPATGAQDVTVELGQFAYYMRNATLDGGTLQYRLDAIDPRYPPPYLGFEPLDHAVTVQYDPPPSYTWFGETPAGLDGVHTQHRIAFPPAGEAMKFLTQHVSYERTDAPAPAQGPLEVVGIATHDPGDARVRLAAGDYHVGIALQKGSDKPLLRARDGRPLMDLSAWDTMLRVDGNLTRLHRHEYNVSADGTSARVTWFADDWSLEQNLSVTSDGVDIAWWWTSARAHRVELHVAHFAAYMQHVTTNGAALAYALSAADPLGGVPQQPEDARDRWVRVDFDRPPALLRLDAAPEGNRSFIASFADNVPASSRTLLAHERVVIGREPVALGPPMVARAAAVEDPLGGRLLLHASGYDASIALTKGSDQPLLRSDEGRALLEISGWESFLRVNEREMPLYRLEHRVNLTGETPCIEWTDAQFILRECIAVASDGMRVAWEWWRAPDAPAQDVSLSVGHFAYFLENAGRNEGTLEYFLAAHDPREQPAGDDAARYHVIMGLEPPPARSPFGSDAFRLEYDLAQPAAGAWTPIFTETLRYEREA